MVRHGVYQGIAVRVEEWGHDGRGATLGLITRDARALAVGFQRYGFERPEIQDYLKIVPADTTEIRFTAAPDPVPPPSRLHVEPEEGWGTFTLRLVTTLRRVTDRVFLIIGVDDDPLRYVQFAGAADRLFAEAPGVDVARGAREEVLREAGWVAPDSGQPNWTSPLALPASSFEFRELAARCVRALQEAYDVADPGVLRYRAWREPDPSAGDAGEAPLELPTLEMRPY